MSYDIFVQDLPASLKPVEKIPDDLVPGPIGVQPNTGGTNDY
jgi:hypothetical protein